MGDVIDDLLAFSHLGRSEMQKTKVNFDELVGKTLGDFEAETRERNIVWKIHALPVVQAVCDRAHKTAGDAYSRSVTAKGPPSRLTA
jgi:light-regulated signal transduction histidine kinase (bacteriophytochrome)